MSNVHQQGYDAYRNLQLGAAIVDSSLKGYKAGKYAAAAYHAAKLGYGLGKYVVNSFSKNEKNMPPTPVKSLKKMGSVTAPYKGSKTSAYVPVRKHRGWTEYKEIKSRGMQTVGPRVNNKKRGSVPNTFGGKIKKGRRKYNSLDYFAKKGVVSAREQGTTAEGSALLKYHAIGVSHATCGADQILIDLGYAFVKSFVSRCFGYTVEDLNQNFIYGGGREIELIVYYRLYPQGTLLNHMFTIGGSTLASFASVFSTWLKGLVDVNSQVQLVKMLVSYKTVGTVGTQIIGQFDLKRAKVEMYAQSNLKIQNRTINAGGNEADDVDAQPLIGKTYDGPGNFYGIQDNYYVPLTSIQSNYLVTPSTATGPMPEPLPLSQMRNCRKIGKMRLDPGQIKTSTLVWRKNLNLNSVLYYIGRSIAANNCMKLGKFRLINLEKELNCLLATDANAIKLGIEIDLKTGTAITLPKLATTTIPVSITPD